MQFSSLLFFSVSTPPSRKRQGGVNRVPQALQACILVITCLTSTRLPGRTEARPYDRMVFSAMYYVENKQSRVAACCDLPGDSFSLCKVSDLASELAALDRKIQLELAPPTPEVAEKENEGQQLKPEAEDVRNRQAQYPENAPPQIRSPADSIVANHVIIGRPGLYAKEETRSKGLKI